MVGLCPHPLRIPKPKTVLSAWKALHKRSRDWTHLYNVSMCTLTEGNNQVVETQKRRPHDRGQSPVASTYNPPESGSFPTRYSGFLIQSRRFYSVVQADINAIILPDV